MGRPFGTGKGGNPIENKAFRRLKKPTAGEMEGRLSGIVNLL